MNVAFFSSIFLFYRVLFNKYGPWFLITVVEHSKAWTVFACSNAEIVGSNPTQGMDVWCVDGFILCLYCPVFR
jgi:hypothetical protein